MDLFNPSPPHPTPKPRAPWRSLARFALLFTAGLLLGALLSPKLPPGTIPGAAAEPTALEQRVTQLEEHARDLENRAISAETTAETERTLHNETKQRLGDAQRARDQAERARTTQPEPPRGDTAELVTKRQETSLLHNDRNLSLQRLSFTAEALKIGTPRVLILDDVIVRDHADLANHTAGGLDLDVYTRAPFRATALNMTTTPSVYWDPLHATAESLTPCYNRFNRTFGCGDMLLSAPPTFIYTDDLVYYTPGHYPGCMPHVSTDVFRIADRQTLLGETKVLLTDDTRTDPYPCWIPEKFIERRVFAIIDIGPGRAFGPAR